ncbi:MAG: IreB family regulatory phosphoprotein [Chitinophagales bacterium]
MVQGGGIVSQEFQGTASFLLERDGKEKVAIILENVYQALQEKGYNPINQLVGYMISGDPAYVTSYKDARAMICKVERDEILEVLLKRYLEE